MALRAWILRGGGGGMKGHDLHVVNDVSRERESIVNRVAKREVGDKMIVCGRAARWWDNHTVR